MTRSVGIVAAVVGGKDTLLVKFYRAYGKADVEGDVPMTVDTIVPIGSVTKQFTAAAILQLRDQGKLSLDDEITKWLPDFDTRGNKVTLRHLLGHTSGVTDLVEMPELRAMQLMRNPAVTRDDVYKVVSHYAFMFPTGTMQLYSNSNFWLLGLVIEKASGMTYEEYVEKRLFEPLGMTRSMYCNNSENVPRRAYGYGMRPGFPGRIAPVIHTATYAAGAICSTAEDMITWLQALHGGKVLTPKSYVELITPSTLNDGTTLRYSMGLFVGEDSRGLRQIGHDGGGFGFGAVANWYPDAQLAVVVLTNSEPTNIRVVSDDLAARSRAAGATRGKPVHGRRVAARRHIQGSRAWQGHGHRGDADAAGDRIRLRRCRGKCPAMGRRLDVPPESGASHLSPFDPSRTSGSPRASRGKLRAGPEREQWSGHGTAVRQGRWLLHPQAAVERGKESDPNLACADRRGDRPAARGDCRALDL